ncbi:MAG: hypothetical protein AXA67_06570 [Methylothermaceae bacteria B42]|nr:MAG: hypothetical protein AXA67_06570 [Methylothermaceae bacteria B42]HHJ39796.1 hypothetical protein [Methylothermaceae bacterium]
MLDGKKEEQKDKTESNDVSFSSSKRRLVKSGALAIPVVMTLRSGAAMALSSAKQCIENAKTEAQGADPLIQNQDDDKVWVRKEVDCRLLESDDGTQFYVYKNPSEPIGIENPDKWLREEDNVEFVEIGQNIQKVRKKRMGTREVMELRKRRAVQGQKMVQAGTTSPKFKVTSEGKCYVLALVDSDGEIVKYGKSGLDEVAITTSCWASIHPPTP